MNKVSMALGLEATSVLDRICETAMVLILLFAFIGILNGSPER
jgi:hypothetical protein